MTWLWDHLKAWHYLNFTSDTAIWEHPQDGSTVYIAFDPPAERVVEMSFHLEFATKAEESGAFSVLQECLVRFALEPSAALA